MNAKLKKTLIILALVVVSLFLFGRLAYETLTGDVSLQVAVFLDSYRHLSWFVGETPEYTDCFDLDRHDLAVFFVLGFISSIVLHIAALFFIVAGFLEIFSKE